MVKCLLGMAVTSAWSRAEVTNSLALAAWTAQQDAFLALWRSQGQLVEGQDLTAGLEDASARLLSDVQSNQLHKKDKFKNINIFFFRQKYL
jgi:hypothetical protein